MSINVRAPATPWGSAIAEILEDLCERGHQLGQWRDASGEWWISDDVADDVTKRASAAVASYQASTHTLLEIDQKIVAQMQDMQWGFGVARPQPDLEALYQLLSQRRALQVDSPKDRVTELREWLVAPGGHWRQHAHLLQAAQHVLPLRSMGGFHHQGFGKTMAPCCEARLIQD